MTKCRNDVKMIPCTPRHRRRTRPFGVAGGGDTAAVARGETAAPLVPDAPTLPSLRDAAAGCTACPLHLTGTQTVFGEGATSAAVMLVGEQPGD